MKFSDFDDLALEANPFTDAYFDAELKALKLRQSTFHVEQVKVGWFTPTGRVDDYLNPNMRFLEQKVPYLALNGHLWMSLTPMEIQSAALAIHRANGHVITLGLGLGYFSLRTAIKENVKKVTVFEKEPLVIEWFHRAYKGRKELAKIEIIEGDARKVFKGYECDFCFTDIYQSMLPDDVLKDARRFRRHNKIRRYHYWGYERVVRDLLFSRMIKNPALFMGRDLRNYIRHWASTPVIQGDNESEMTMGEMRWEPTDHEFLRKAQRLMTDFPI